MNHNNYDIAIIGLGAVGAATAYHLSAQGRKVVGIDQFSPPHNLGSTHGETRITRLAVGEGKEFIPIVRRSHELWKSLQIITGKKIFHEVGGILMDSGAEAWAKHGSQGFFERTRSFAEENEIPHEILDSKELKRRYKEFNLENTGMAFFEPTAGYIIPELAVELQLNLAEIQGARIITHTKVQGLQPLPGGGVRIETNHGILEAGQVCISAGPWIKDFIPSFDRPHFKICRQLLHWLPLESTSFFSSSCPVYMWGFGPQPEDFVYGFPSLNGQTVKMSSESFVASNHPDTIQRVVGEEEQLQFLKEKIKGRFNGLKNIVKSSKTCIYTVTPDSYFVVDRLPDFPEVLVASACSGHGFKHSAGLGETIAQTLLDNSPSISLEAFKWPSTFN